MKIGIFLSYVGLGSNLLHLTYCHQIAKKYGPVSVITLCKNLEQVIGDDPLIKEVIYIEKYYKKFSDIFKLSKLLKKYDFNILYIFYPSIRLFFASKLAGVKKVYSYNFFTKKNLHLVKAAKKFVEESLNIKSCPTETKIFISEKNKQIAQSNLDSNKKNIVIGAGSSGVSTRWGETNYINLIKKLIKKKDCFFYILCGPKENEIANKIIDEVNSNICLSLSNKNIAEVVPIISACDIYIGNDSFGHHVCSQRSIPSLIIMLDTPKAYSDYSKNQFRILPPEVSIDSVTHDSKISPDAIKVDLVLEKVLKLLN